VEEVNGEEPDHAKHRIAFDNLRPRYPEHRLKLENEAGDLSMRLMDLISPIGMGQRGLIVSPPKAGKTILLQKIANAILENQPDVHLIVLLIDERPEEVTDMEENVAARSSRPRSTSRPTVTPRSPRWCWRRPSAWWKRAATWSSCWTPSPAWPAPTTSRCPTRGRSCRAVWTPTRCTSPSGSSARPATSTRAGSLTIIATALVDTGSRMDEVIFEEFKGTGNMEVILDRHIADKRIFPAIDINRSSTRKEELLLTEAS
jgi:transcription termination factor Rho